jgi:pimeloyl-ACP methyl ester carboxylesterase
VEAAQLLLVHGAGSGPDVFSAWARDFSPAVTIALDLQADLDPGLAGMADYADIVAAATAAAERPVAVVGWSMGGLVAMMGASIAEPDALVIVEPSPPSEIQGSRPGIRLRHGTFDPVAVYGPGPRTWAVRPESRRARDERKRGISVPRLPRHTLVVYGRSFPDDRGRDIVECYGVDGVGFPGLGHADLVSSPMVRAEIRSYLAGVDLGSVT